MTNGQLNATHGGMISLPTGSIINDSALWTLDGLGNTTGYLCRERLDAQLWDEG